MVVTPEEKQLQKENLLQLQDNKVFKEMLTQLKQRLITRRREQRLALQKCDKDTGMLLEGVQVGIEEALKIYEANFAEDPQTPTIKY